MTPNEFFEHVIKTSDFECLRGFHPKLGKYLLEYDAEDGMIMNLWNSEAMPINTIELQCEPMYRNIHDHIKAAIRWNNEKLISFTVTKKEPSLFDHMASIFRPVHQEDYLRENQNP